MTHSLPPFLIQTNALNEVASSASAFLILMLALLFIMAIAAGAEVAFFSLKAKDVNYLKSNEHGSTRLAVRLLEQPETLAATLKGAKYILSIAIIIVANFFVKFFLPEGTYPFLPFFVAFVIVLFCLLLFGEILPKVYARGNNMRLVFFAAPVIGVLHFFLKPFIRILIDSNEYKEEKENRLQRTETDDREFEQTVEQSLGRTATKEEVEIFRGILKFGKITVKQIMHPRMDISSIGHHWNFEKVRNKLLNSGFSRLPVYDGSIDNIVGMLHTKDFLPYIELEDFEWRKLMRPVYFVHEHKLIEDLLREFQQKRNHIGIVVDEFGGTSGLVTLEDVMEEIIGDIRDEFDDDELDYRRIDEHNFIFEGKTLINNFSRLMGVNFDYFDEVRGDSDSLAGLILEIAGRFPLINEKIHFNGFDFIVLSIEKLRITKIKVSRIEGPEEK